MSEANEGCLQRFVGRSHSVWYGYGRTYNAHCFTGVEITSDSLTAMKRAAKSLGWKLAEISREDGKPEWVSRDGKCACETYLWLPRRKSNTGRQVRRETKEGNE